MHASSFSVPRLLLFSLVFLNLVATLAMARPTPAESTVTALELDGPREASAAAPSSSVRLDGGESGVVGAGAPESALRHTNKHHRPFDKSIAGAEVMLGGLATAVFAAIFAYIRVTRKRNSENKV